MTRPSNSNWQRSGDKVIALEALADVTENARACGQKIVHCHGVFDLLHVGHLRHLEAARRFGDLLVVTVTPDAFVNKGPGRPAFSAESRAEALAALASVDFVAINRWPTAVETIGMLRPHAYAKGSEYADKNADRTGGIIDEEAALSGHGGRLVFTDEATYSSSHLLQHHTDMYSQEVRTFLGDFREEYPSAEVLAAVDAAASRRVLVIGETIIDEYQYCDAIGKSSKEPTLAVKPYSVERFGGGILAVANHVAPFCEQVTALTAIGSQDGSRAFVEGALAASVQPRFIELEHAPTITKRRFIDRYFFHKLFEVYEMDDSELTGPDEAALLDALDEALPQHDVVIVVDYGHGLLTPRVVDKLTKQAPFLAVNAQSNAGNLGYNTVSKYPRADYVTLAENELRLDSRDRHGPLPPLARRVSERCGARTVAVTRGAQGCLLFDRSAGFVEVPALAGTIKDRMGAGDTFMAITALTVAGEAPVAVSGFLGNAMAAGTVATVGHRGCIDKAPFVRHVECLLK
ncbi:MAG: PfkB family carbohydrate kinase [Planctomycetota bacterium]